MPLHTLVLHDFTWKLVHAISEKRKQYHVYVSLGEHSRVVWFRLKFTPKFNSTRISTRITKKSFNIADSFNCTTRFKFD